MSQESKFSQSDRESGRLYLKEFGGAMVGYVIVMLITGFLVRRYPQWAIPLAIAPMVPLGFALRGALGFFRRGDEFVRRMQLEAISFAFVTGVMLTMSYGLIESYAKLPRISWTWVAPVFIALHGIGSFLASRRYR